MTQAPIEGSKRANAVPARPAYGSDLVVDLLDHLGIEYVAFTPGATFRGLHDSLVNAGGPQIVECLHEEISVAVAHGYAKATGKLMAVAVHDVVGLQHASMAIFNAWCDRVPMLILGATGPMDATKRRPWIDWIHTANVQATQVRDYVKWDDQPGSLAAIPESIIQAVRLAATEPCGPVYVCMDIEFLEQACPASLSVPDLERFAAPGRLAPDPAATDTLARWLLDAERPVIVADLVGRSEAAFDALIALAETLAIPVVDPEGEYWKVSLNFPTQHPLNLSADQESLVAEADVVLGLELRDPFGALNRVERQAAASMPLYPPSARLALISLAHLLTRSWVADYQRLQPADLSIAAELDLAVPAILERVRELLPDTGFAEREARRRMLSERSAMRFARWRELAAAPGPSEVAIPDAYLAGVLDDLTRGADRVLANGHLRNWAHRLWSLDRPYQYLGGQGGAGLGYGLGASIGAALAHSHTDRLVIDLQADGDALFTPSALWTAAHYRLPLLIVIENNRSYDNSVVHAERVARARGRSIENTRIGTEITDPAVDFAALARSFGVHAEGPIGDPSALEPALQRGLRIVMNERRPALVDVLTAPERE